MCIIIFRLDMKKKKIRRWISNVPKFLITGVIQKDSDESQIHINLNDIR